jgi:hypothetical protein
MVWIVGEVVDNRLGYQVFERTGHVELGKLVITIKFDAKIPQLNNTVGNEPPVGTIRAEVSIKLSWSCKMGLAMTRMSLNRNRNRSFAGFELTTWRTGEDSNLRGGSSIGIVGNDESTRLIH